MDFLTPLGALLAVLVAAPVAAFLFGERGRRRVGALLHFAEPSPATRFAPAVALIVVAALFGLAATQPTLVRRSQQHVRTDAEAWFVLDTSLSMKATAGQGSPTRFQHAQALASFPDRGSIDYLRDVGVTHVLVDSRNMRSAPLARLADFPELELWMTDGNLRIYLLAAKS